MRKWEWASHVEERRGRKDNRHGEISDPDMDMERASHRAQRFPPSCVRAPGLVPTLPGEPFRIRVQNAGRDAKAIRFRGNGEEEEMGREGRSRSPESRSDLDLDCVMGRGG